MIHQVGTPTCFVCGNATGGSGKPPFVELNEEQYKEYLRWQENRHDDKSEYRLIQVAMPSIDADAREQILSGTHGECWRAFAGDEEDYDDDLCDMGD